MIFKSSNPTKKKRENKQESQMVLDHLVAS